MLLDQNYSKIQHIILLCDYQPKIWISSSSIQNQIISIIWFSKFMLSAKSKKTKLGRLITTDETFTRFVILNLTFLLLHIFLMVLYF